VLATAAFALEESDYQVEFLKFMAEHQKQYSDSEIIKRYSIFKNNVDFINAENAKGNLGYTLGINLFADLSAEEFQATMMLSPQPDFSEIAPATSGDSVATNPANDVDWRTKGVVGPVANQGQCGSAWAFSVIGATESAWAIAHGKYVALSIQQLVDCTGGQGCSGGSPTAGYDWIIKNKGICSAGGYPYVARQKPCNTSCPIVASLKSYENLEKTEAAMEAAVTKGVVSIALDVTSSFQFYTGGIYKGPCGTQLNHAALVVGFTKDYWIVKNSWGTSWGAAGYILMARGSNLCGMFNAAQLPIAA